MDRHPRTVTMARAAANDWPTRLHFARVVLASRKSEGRQLWKITLAESYKPRTISQHGSDDQDDVFLGIHYDQDGFDPSRWPTCDHADHKINGSHWLANGETSSTG